MNDQEQKKFVAQISKEDMERLTEMCQDVFGDEPADPKK